MKCIPFIIVTALLISGFVNQAEAGDEVKVQLVITGGHETDPHDHGRPVILIGHALGVKPEIFRAAFSRVVPAPAGREPEPEQVRRNKTVLLGVLRRYGVTNELLDRVSNYYRYRPGSGSLWPTTGATAFAILKDGAVTSITITDAGSGYNLPPRISVPNHPEIALKATLTFGRDLKTNGSLLAITKEADADPAR